MKRRQVACLVRLAMSDLYKGKVTDPATHSKGTNQAG
jgi:hypothetical protein